MMIDPCMEVHSGPDSLGRYTFTLHWQTKSPPWCSTCGGNVEHEGELIVCTGPVCGARSLTMPRGQVFFEPLRDYPLCTHSPDTHRRKERDEHRMQRV